MIFAFLYKITLGEQNEFIYYWNYILIIQKILIEHNIYVVVHTKKQLVLIQKQSQFLFA